MFVIIKKEKHMEKPDSSLLFRQPMYADKRQWKQFLSIFLLAAGVGFTVAGIIFFFAYNWEDLPKFAKLVCAACGPRACRWLSMSRR